MNETISIRNLLKKLDFMEIWGTMTDQEPAFRYDFGNLELTATQVMNARLRPVFIFGGCCWEDGRSFREIEFEMPLEVASFEQGVAWIAHGVGSGFRPRKTCRWLLQGRDWQDHLPWIQQRKAYEARPQCKVDREWFKVAAKKLRELAAAAKESDLAVFGFDGEVLRINACGYKAAMPAMGREWAQQYAIRAQQMDFLPKRLMNTTIHLSVWDDHLSIGKRCFRLA